MKYKSVLMRMLFNGHGKYIRNHAVVLILFLKMLFLVLFY